MSPQRRGEFSEPSDLEQTITERLVAQPGLVFAVLYGSAVTGGLFRDLDVAICLDRQVVPAEQDMDYAFDLAEALEAATSNPVDVRVINAAPLPFRYNVSRGRPLVVNDRGAWHTFLERTWDEWWDFEPVAMQYLRDLAWTK
jgi:uncharacterized protein